MLAPIGENCGTNQSVAKTLKLPLFDCASHTFQLSVKEIISENKEVFEMVQSLMLKQRTLILQAKL